MAQINISGTINENTAVTSVSQPNCSDCSPTCKDTIGVDDASAFQIGDRALIIQMKGASINTTNTSSGGQITAIANAGNYEFFIIDSVDNAGNLIWPVYGLVKQYDAAGQVQVIRIPNYGNATVTVTGTLTAPTWQESTGVGGVVALTAKKLILNADIDVIGKGFKGNTMTTNGTPDNCSVDPTSAYTLNSTASQSYTKGEGIVADNTSFNRGRAPRANGGGSGISGDSGGGGGSSYGAGGQGGYRWCDELGSQDGGPDIPAGGLGGVSLSSYFTQDKLFLGGAGGSGFVTTNNPSDATDGGGIVILFVDTLVGNGYSILADGTTPTAVNPVGAPDGGGGGGGGGSVLLNVLAIPDTLTVTADGGDGQDLNTTNYHGPGGGGGGGVLLYSLPSLPAAVTFSADGGASGVHSNGYDNGADSGDVGGTFGLYTPIQNVNYFANIDNDPIAPVCDIDDDGDGITDIQEIYTGDHDGDDTLDWADSDFCADIFDGVSGWSCAVDGLPNPTADMDDDGYANFIDSDFPYCGTFTLGVDEICSNFDPDGDGIPSHLDLDSDNDGIPDIIEAGGADTNGDGQADVTTDTDGDGLYDIFDNDNTDGPQGSSPCTVQPGCLDLNSYSILPVPDSDNDTIPDYLDSDSDNDGIPDVVEAGGVDNNGDGRIDNFGDADNDGLTDAIDALICEDSVDIVSSNNQSYGTYIAGSSTGVTNGANTSGAPDDAYGELYQTGDRLVLDFGSVYPIGSTYVLRWRRKTSYGSGPTADMVVQESSDASSWTTHSTTPQDNTQVFKNTVLTTEVATRYLRLYTLTGSNDDFDFDAVTVGDSSISYNVYQVCISNTPIFTTGSDTDGDALPNSLTYGDSDGDGIYDYIDLDSDNDGVPDVVEAGGTDSDGDGRADGYVDADDDGFNDIVDGDPTNVLVIADDSDGGNLVNVLQRTGIDTDNDGKPNSIISDDFDNDGIPNQLDLDSDGDGISDVLESGGTDANSDGLVDGTATDTDGDGFADGVDGDVGNDGTAENSANALVATGADGGGDGAPDTYPNSNFDSDGNYNALDIDSDNDGITDNIEGQTSSGYVAPSGNDTDGDGIDDSYDPTNSGTYTVPTDTDSDGDPDYLDLDSDNDTYPDEIEGHDMDGDGFADASSPSNTGVSGGSTDVDGDGLLDGFDNNTSSTNPTNGGLTPSSHPDVNNPGGDRDWREFKDTDSDGISDHLDLDDDNDGVPDVDEALGYDPNGNEDGDEFPNWLDTNDDGNGGDGSTTDYTDANGDGIPDVYDFDRDGIPNHLDKDSDNDGIVDILEAGGTDNNQDGEVDYPTPGDASTMVDADNDGLADALDDVDSGSGGGEVTSGTALAMPNTDGTGNADLLDIDADGDGIIDNIEAQATTGSPVQATAVDTDGDGISDAFDPDNGGTYLSPEDTDGDGDADYVDTDSDDDGETDLIEGWDTDGDGVADTSPANSDTDGDGLDDNFDNVASLNLITNWSNNAQDALDFPNTDDGTSERDWREEPCAGGAIELAPLNTTTTVTDFCQMDANWTYYYDPGDPTQLLFAIEHTPAGGNTNDFTAEVSLTVSSDPQTEGGVYSAEDIPNEDATFVMGRYYNISITSGSLNGNVNIRFYYDQVDADTLLAVAQRWNATNAGGTSFVSGLRWFSMNSGTFDPGSADLTDEGIANSTEWFPTSTGTEDGYNFAQFSSSSLTGGGLAYSVGTNSVILPVELLNFNAYVISEDEVRLSWATASEIDNDYFMVERSSDLDHWVDIQRVEGAGNSSMVLFYDQLDTNPLNGRSFYRLRQVDYNGTIDHSESREVVINDMLDADGAFLLYPNPSSGSVFIQINSDAALQLSIRNTLGQEVRSLNAPGNGVIEVKGLASGVYFISAGSEHSINLKFVITD
ncbi:MAG: T9SS type A sorting domain-containing protein [Cryomorphaceae bacterium]